MNKKDLQEFQDDFIKDAKVSGEFTKNQAEFLGRFFRNYMEAYLILAEETDNVANDLSDLEDAICTCHD